MPTSQNGFPAGNPSLLNARAVIPGTDVDFPGGVRKGAVEIVLMYVAAQVRRRAEGTTGYGCWGYNYRAISGSVSLSNHSSGTAIDYNAPQHPLGVAGTWTAAERATVHAILREVGSVVRWGDDYSGRKDGMHFEINAPLSSVERVAAKIVGASNGGSTSGTLERGARGAAVKRLQQLLNRRLAKAPGVTVDSAYGKQTENAVSRFGAQVGIRNPVNGGEYGGRTKFYLDPPLLRQGTALTAHVSRAQHALNVRNGNKNVRVDGVFGPNTKKAVVAYQNKVGIKGGGGEIGPRTWDHLISGH